MKNTIRILIEGKDKEGSIKLDKFIDLKTAMKFVPTIIECEERYKKVKNLHKY
ncbi:MAG: hypothetical protein AABY22_19515 [Nanoarchaeota archaeon]